MEIKITVERRRGSVTQGMVDVLINGEKVMDFGDTIELIKPGEEYHGLSSAVGRARPRTPLSSSVCFTTHTTTYII